MHAVLLGLPGLQILVCINVYEDVSLLREESAARNTCSGNLQVLHTELFEEMPHEAAPDSSSGSCWDSLQLCQAGNISEAYENGS